MTIKFKIFEGKNMAFTDLLNDSNHLGTKFTVFKYGVFSGPYFPVFSPNTGK